MNQLFSIMFGIVVARLLCGPIAHRLALAWWRRRLRTPPEQRLAVALDACERAMPGFAEVYAREHRIAAAVERQRTAPHDPWLDVPFTPEEEAQIAAAEKEGGAVSWE